MINSESVINYITEASKTVPVEVFVFVGSIVEELIGPIPSPLINVTAGSILAINKQSNLHVLYVGLLGSIAKTAVSTLFYYLGDKAEDVITNKFGKYIGVTHKEVEQLGKRFSGGKKDVVVLLLLRAIPIFPSGAVSILCGVLRTHFKVFLVTSFIGLFIRNIMFLYVGYLGIETFQTMSLFASTEKLITIACGLVLVAGGVWIYSKRKLRI